MDEVIDNNLGVTEAPPPTTENHEKPVVDDTSKQSRAWAEMRVKNRQLENELKAQRDSFEQWKQSQEPKEVDEFDSIGADEYISKGKVDRLVEKRSAKIAEEIAERKINQMMEQQRNSQFMERLSRQYPDFQDVVNIETLALLEEQDPELANTIAELKDPYKIGLQSYKFIKAMNISDKVPDSRRSKEIDQKLADNAKTVQTPQAYDKRPMAQAFKMSQAERTALYNEMMGFAQQAGMGY